MGTMTKEPFLAALALLVVSCQMRTLLVKTGSTESDDYSKLINDISNMGTDYFYGAMYYGGGGSGSGVGGGNGMTINVGDVKCNNVQCSGDYSNNIAMVGCCNKNG